MKRKKLTTYDYLACKGKRQLSNLLMPSIKHIPHSTNFTRERSNARLSIFINNKEAA